jgi:hypothetical protein
VSAPLTVHNAQVTTATVQIRTLTVSGKQVTLAVFRQLIEKPVIDAGTGELAGLPWGTVNYHPDKWCTEAGHEHLHVVWQDGEELRRAYTWKPDYRDSPGFLVPDEEAGAFDVLVQASYCLNGHQDLPWFKRSRPYDRSSSIRFRLDDMDCETFSKTQPDPYSSYPPGSSPYPSHQCLGEADRDAALALARKHVAAEHQRIDRFRASWQALAELPQLFIAV